MVGLCELSSYAYTSEVISVSPTLTPLHYLFHIRVDSLEELEIMKATTSDCMLNTVHNSNPLYRIPHSVQDQTMAHTDNS